MSFSHAKNDHMNSPKPIHDAAELIEFICQQGCTVVRKHIEILIHSEQNSNASPLPEIFQQTNKEQQKKILDELITIMAVYDNKDCGN